MSVSYGFYNSLNNDRVYEALDFSRIFDGIINDGIFANIGTALAVEESEGMFVNVGVGRAWFNGTWTYNDSLLPLEIPESEVVLDRIDAVILEIDKSDNSRTNTIYVKTGEPSSDAKKPEMEHTETLHQYPLAYITVKAGATSITQSEIENAVGFDANQTPLVTGLLEVMSIDAIVAQWQDQWNDWTTDQQIAFIDWFNYFKSLVTEEKFKNITYMALTQEEYDNLPEEMAHRDDIMYMISDSSIEILHAGSIVYNKTTSVKDKLDSIDDSIDGIDERVKFLEGDLANLPTGILQPGETTITINDGRIKHDGLIDIYVDKFGESPDSVDVADGRVTLTFAAALEEPMVIKIRCL